MINRCGLVHRQACVERGSRNFINYYGLFRRVRACSAQGLPSLTDRPTFLVTSKLAYPFGSIHLDGGGNFPLIWWAAFVFSSSPYHHPCHAPPVYVLLLRYMWIIWRAGGGMPRTEITAKKLSIQCVWTVEREKPHQIRDVEQPVPPKVSQYSHMNTWTYFIAV